MTALVPVWTPEDFADTVAAAREQERIDAAVAVATLGRRARGWWYRGRHRADRFSIRVSDLTPLPGGCDAKAGPCLECRRMLRGVR